MPLVAVLGATSHIAKDFIVSAGLAGYEMCLFSRRPEQVSTWLSESSEMAAGHASLGYGDFGARRYDAIINFVGSGDPARTAAMGAKIFDVTHHFDSMACNVLRDAPDTRYVFLSSGAAYGTSFYEPAGRETLARIPINDLSSQDWYCVAKLHAETQHRATFDRAIVDLQIFGYFSRTVNIEARYFVTDILRAIRDGHEFETGLATMQRDYLNPRDFFALVDSVLRAPPANAVLDAYSLAPVEKFALMNAMKAAFGLRYRIAPSPPVVAATGNKLAYYSTNYKAAEFGYQPQFTSLEAVLAESKVLLEGMCS